MRPEFIKIFKKNELQKYKSSASEGIVEKVSFRGNYTEITVNSNGSLLTAKRDLDQPSVKIGEKVDVFIYRIFVTVGNDAFLIENKSLTEDSIVI